MLKTEHRQGRAVVKVVSTITEELAIELVAHLRRLRDECFHERVEPEIASNGGSVLALGYFLDALDGFRAGGLEVVTRALTSAASAAADLVALGDRREASGSAVLRFHTVRTAGVNEVTAQTAGALLDMLETADDRLMRRLVERGLRTGPAPLPPVGEAAKSMLEADWRIAAALAGAASSGSADAGRGSEGVLKRLRERVRLCLRDSDGAGLRRLYDELFAFDAPISAALARELRLLDAVVNPGARESRAERPDAACRIPEWRAAFDPDGSVDRRVLCRHVLILGETGSGKTASRVLPAAAATFDPNNPVGCVLVVDPKREIGPELRRLAASGEASVRTFNPKAGAGGPALNLMRGPDWSVNADLEAGRCLSAAQKILLRAASLSPANPAATLAGRGVEGLRDPYWSMEGARMAKTAVALAVTALRRRADLFAGLSSFEPLLNAPKSAVQALRRLGEKAGVLAPENARLRAVADRLLAAADEVRDVRFSERRPRLEAALSGGLDAGDDWEGRRDAEKVVAEAVGQAVSNLCRSARRLFPGAGGQGFRADLKRIADAAAENGEESGLERAAAALPLAAMRCLDDAELRPAPNVLALASTLLMAAFRRNSIGGGWEDCGGEIDAMHLATVLRPLADSAEEREMLEQVGHWSALAESSGSGHYAGVQALAQNCLWEFADAAPAWTLYFGVEPQLGCGGPAASALLDFDAAVDAESGCAVFLVQPALGAAQDALLAKALKARFFEAVLGSRKRQRGGGRMPLVGYVADECHRFVTSDPTHGEQSFLDTCRSFGAFCVLACQSASSLKHALAGAGGGPRAGRGGSLHPAQQHRHQAVLPHHRRGHQGAGRQAAPGADGRRQGGSPPPAVRPAPRGVLRGAGRRALRAAAAGALRRHRGGGGESSASAQRLGEGGRHAPEQERDGGRRVTPWARGAALCPSSFHRQGRAIPDRVETSPRLDGQRRPVGGSRHFRQTYCASERARHQMGAECVGRRQPQQNDL